MRTHTNTRPCARPYTQWAFMWWQQQFKSIRGWLSAVFHVLSVLWMWDSSSSFPSRALLLKPHRTDCCTKYKNNSADAVTVRVIAYKSIMCLIVFIGVMKNVTRICKKWGEDGVLEWNWFFFLHNIKLMFLFVCIILVFGQAWFSLGEKNKVRWIFLFLCFTIFLCMCMCCIYMCIYMNMS